MKRKAELTLIAVFAILIVGFMAVNIVLRNAAIDVIAHSLDERPEMIETPADYGLDYEEIKVTTEDGLQLHSWYVPGENGATTIVQHGSPGGRQDPYY